MAAISSNILTALGAQQIDTQSLVSSLVAAQKQPRQEIIDAAKKKADVAISNIASLKNALNNLQTAATEIGSLSNLSKLAVTSTNADVATAVANGTAMVQPGVIALAVSKLAKPQRTAGAEITQANIATGGTITITPTGSSPINITVPQNSTAAAIRTTINTALASAGAKITCTVVDTGTGTAAEPNSVFIFEGQSGKGNGFSMSGDCLGFSDASKISNISAAQNSEFTVNGLAVQRSSNSVSDVIPGLTLNLNNESSDPTRPLSANISTSVDSATISANVKNFVDMYNGVTEFLDKVTGPVVAGDDVAGSLSNSSTVRAIKNALRTVMISQSSGKSGAVTDWTSVGVIFDRNGVLQYDASKLTSAIATNYQDVVRALSNGAPSPYLYSGQPSGMAGDIAVKTYGMIKTTGTVPAMEQGYKDKETRLTKEQDKLDKYVAKLTDNYTKQFAAMNAAISSLNSDKTQLTNMMNMNNKSN